ncbi:MAG: UPF0262 family protein [Phreatobacter sp.]|uniref:UPF0262 family protein n=1 Tax=Phreatobacter sp. TaxID=1966341 RepID=UPI001A43D4DA|nr:UPF0262 family protein [Phreatobacter sp.]MBL8571811.1 UPF0262 family protein [Phreatobacter sp.]
MTDGDFRIVHIELDERTVVRRSPDIEQERAVAIVDLLDDNRFVPVGDRGGPYKLLLSIADNRLVLDIARADGSEVDRLQLPLLPFRRIVRDYFMVCETYYDAIKHASPSRIEAIDMGRRALHNEGSNALQARLADRVEVDFETARRLFTLICVLHIRPTRGDGT